MPGVPSPEYENAGGQFPAPRVPVEAPIAAFGGGEALGGLRAASDFAGVVGDIATKQAAMANTVSHADIDAQLAELKNNITIQTEQMKGKDALGAQAYASNAWNQGSQKILQANSPNVAVMRSAQASIASRGNELNMDVTRHATNETFNYTNDTYASQLNTSKNNAILNSNNKESVDRQIAYTDSVANQYFKLNGISTEKTKDGKYSDPNAQAFIVSKKSAIYRGVIETNIESGRYDLAKQNFKDAKDGGNLIEADLLALDSKMTQAKSDHVSLSAWGNMKGDRKLFYADGEPNMTRILNIAENPEQLKKYAGGEDADKLTDAEKEKIKTSIKGYANELYGNVRQQTNERMLSFTDAVSRTMENGGSFAQVSKYPYQYARTPTELDRMKDYIDRQFDSSIKSNSSVFNQLWENQSLGVGGGKEDLDLALKNNQITTGNYRTLIQREYDIKKNGVNAPYEQGMEMAQRMALTHFNGNPAEASDWLANFRKDHKAGTREEILKAADEGLNVEPKKNWFTMGGHNAGAYNRTADLKTVQNRVVSQIGGEQYNALAGDLSGASPLTTETRVNGLVESLSQDFGADALKIGGAVNNAILSIKRKNLTSKTPEKVNEYNIRGYLKTYPNGIFN